MPSESSHRLEEQQRGDRRDEGDEVEDAEKARPLLIRKHPLMVAEAPELPIEDATAKARWNRSAEVA
jgi:hypothetical protein